MTSPVLIPGGPRAPFPRRPHPLAPCPLLRVPGRTVTSALCDGGRADRCEVASRLLPRPAVAGPPPREGVSVRCARFCFCGLCFWCQTPPKNLLPRLTSGSSPPVLSSGSFGVSGLHPSLPAIWADFCACEGERPGCGPPPWPALSSAVSRGRSLPFIWRWRPPVHKFAARPCVGLFLGSLLCAVDRHV